MTNEEMKNLNQETLNEVAGGADGRRYYVDRFGGEKVAGPFVSEAEAQGAGRPFRSHLRELTSSRILTRRIRRAASVSKLQRSTER